MFLFLLGLPGKLLSLIIPSYALNDAAVREEAFLGVGTSTVYFTGDIMLARHVESLMLREGSDYPYRNLQWLTESPAYIIGNFESALPATHVKTPTGAFRFSTNVVHIPALRAAGFTHLSLANNHALDYGEHDLERARAVLASSSLVTFGHPTKVGASSLTYLDVGGETVAILALHTLYTAPKETELAEVLAEARDKSQYQIVYVHWGVEYEHRPSESQRNLAKLLIKEGVDLIVGHHPHVIQAVEQINGVPVFYSLGNFIFDQYFSKAVQDGLVLKLEMTHTSRDLSLLPVTYRSSQAQPRLMTETEQEKTLEMLAAISSEELREGLLAGKLTLPLPLATLTETAIIGE